MHCASTSKAIVESEGKVPGTIAPHDRRLQFALDGSLEVKGAVEEGAANRGSVGTAALKTCPSQVVESTSQPLEANNRRS